MPSARFVESPAARGPALRRTGGDSYDTDGDAQYISEPDQGTRRNDGRDRWRNSYPQQRLR